MFEQADLYYTNQSLGGVDERQQDSGFPNVKASFRNFIQEFSRENVRIYEAEVLKNRDQRKYSLNLHLSDLKTYNQTLYEKFISNPLETLIAMEDALAAYSSEKGLDSASETHKPDWQIHLVSDQQPKKMRRINNAIMGRLIVVNGIVVNCTKPYLKASLMRVQCKSCGGIKNIKLNPGETPVIPRKCGMAPSTKVCELDSYVILPEGGQMLDEQKIKLQEHPEEVPTGQIARTSTLVLNRYNVDKCSPGDRIKVTGILMVYDSKDADLGFSYIYVTGVEKIVERNFATYTQQEEEAFKKLAKDPTIYMKIFSSIAPAIYGAEDVKKAIACMLFGGSRKKLPDGTNLRGDINVLMIGDPSTAKSQFLKFVEQTASTAIYTSGKGSSAAGLTATVNKDPQTQQFQIEGGAFVLASGGIVCIDQFDKMDPNDRVAIHEAMQQQTISVAKAGITTRLNARTSVFAAANPMHGSFADIGRLIDQCDLKSTILSRFDAVFIIRDLNTPQNNERIAKHILQIHQGKTGARVQSASEIPFDVFKKYISFARNKCFPRLSSEACEKLQNLYVADRQKSKQGSPSGDKSNNMLITVRQLEAIIRLAEALAKMRLQGEVTTEHVDEAHRLFQVSTLKWFEQSRQVGFTNREDQAQIMRMEQKIKKRVWIGHKLKWSKLKEDLDSYNPMYVDRALSNLIRRGEFKELKNSIVMREK